MESPKSFWGKVTCMLPVQHVHQVSMHVEIFAQHYNEEANPLRFKWENDRSFPLIYRAGEFEVSKSKVIEIKSFHQCIIGLVISAVNANELTCAWKLFAKSGACSPWTKRVWMRSRVENGSRFIGVKGITKAPAQVWHGDLMCQMAVMMKNEWLSFHQALKD